MIDALKGYHQGELDEESSGMTTFSTPFSRYRNNRLPFGVSLAIDDYGRRLANIFDHFPNCRRVVEDIQSSQPLKRSMWISSDAYFASPQTKRSQST